MQKNFLKELLKSSETVFSFKELLLKFKEDDPETLKAKLHYYVKNGDLHQIRRGLYSKDMNYNRFELANKIFTPSYISFETVLFSAGVIFQRSEQIFVASYQTREVICDKVTYVFRTIHQSILTNSKGIDTLPTYTIASPERAFLDIIYLNNDYHFDNLEPLNWNKVYEILTAYGDNKSMYKQVKLYNSSVQDNL